MRERVARYRTSADTDRAAVVTSAQDAYENWSRRVSVSSRTALIKRVAEVHRERRVQLAEIIVREMGKPLDQALGEVDFAAAIYEYYVENGAHFLAEEPIPLADGSGEAFIRRAGLGVLLGIMPWNFPYYQVARFAGPNIIAGNTILLKHAPQCPESAAAIEQIFADAIAGLGG